MAACFPVDKRDGRLEGACYHPHPQKWLLLHSKLELDLQHRLACSWVVDHHRWGLGEGEFEGDYHLECPQEAGSPVGAVDKLLAVGQSSW